MAIDKADWHWDDTEKLYRKTNNVEGKLTEEQQEEIWLLASNHIGLFLRWLIDRGFNELIDESDEESCVQVREGKIITISSILMIMVRLVLLKICVCRAIALYQVTMTTTP